MPDKVECRSDTSFAGEPVALFIHNRREPVLQVLATWRTPQVISYRVMAANMKIYDCSYSEADDNWTIIEI